MARPNAPAAHTGVSPKVKQFADDTTARYAQMAGTLAGQVARMRQGLAGTYSKLVVLKQRLHDEITDEENPGEEMHEAYLECCRRIVRIQQALGNLEGIANRDGRIADSEGSDAPASQRGDPPVRALPRAGPGAEGEMD